MNNPPDTPKENIETPANSALRDFLITFMFAPVVGAFLWALLQWPQVTGPMRWLAGAWWAFALAVAWRRGLSFTREGDWAGLVACYFVAVVTCCFVYLLRAG